MLSLKISKVVVGKLSMIEKNLFVKNQIEVLLNYITIIKTSAGLLIYK